MHSRRAAGRVDSQCVPGGQDPDVAIGCAHLVDRTAMRPATTVAIVVLLVAILLAFLIQFL